MGIKGTDPPLLLVLFYYTEYPFTLYLLVLRVRDIFATTTQIHPIVYRLIFTLNPISFLKYIVSLLIYTFGYVRLPLSGEIIMKEVKPFSLLQQKCISLSEVTKGFNH